MEITQTQSKPVDYFSYRGCWIAVAVTGIIILMLYCSFPTGTIANLNETNYRISKELCFNNTVYDEGEHVINSYYGQNITLSRNINNVTRTWDESTKTCLCNKYYLTVGYYNYSCNLTYWFIPRDMMEYIPWMGYDPINSSIYWCDKPVNCTRLKYRHGEFDINGNQ